MSSAFVYCLHVAISPPDKHGLCIITSAVGSDTISGPSPIFVVCGCLEEKGVAARGAAGAAERPAVSQCICFQFPPHRPSLSSVGLLLPSHLSSFLLLPVCLSISVSTKLPIRLSICLSAGLAVCGVAAG